jgi:subtilase family serine protease
MVALRRAASRLPFLLIAILAVTLHEAEAGRVLQGHVPPAARALLPLRDVSPKDRLQLAIGLPVRDQAALDQFVKGVSDPTSPNFRQYLTPEQFTEKFGPTQEEYEAVIHFAEAHGLKVTNRHPNRLVVDVSGSVADVQRTFHITMRHFRHPAEERTFFAPDADPVLDAPVPILQISGLSNYWIPRPRMRVKPFGVFDSNPSPKVGSGPDGTFSGNDFRAAYLPGVSLTGAGQSLGLLQFDGYNPNNIFIYESTANLPNVPLQNVLVDGFSGNAGSANGEVCLDIEVAIAMAPGLSQIIVYEAPNSSPWEDILSRMANDNQAKQLSCSWGGGPPSPTAEQIFQQMAAQGQTFFNASGDDGADVDAIPFPNDSPNIVQVGGTTLGTSSGGGAWAFETTWNWGTFRNGTIASGGGISQVYPIPSWQQGINMGTNQGSTTFRNYPDVALTADNIYNVSDNGQGGSVGGTSASAPLWAAFTALVNQQAASEGKPPVGFINPAVYQIGASPSYTAVFHDITTGDNITNRSSGRFQAGTGYDLCTGWGTPTASLISALISPGAAITTYNVTTSVSPANSGVVTGTATYPAGSQATVTATAFPGFIFNGWTENGGVVSTSASYTFTLNSNRDLVATFAVNTVQYSVNVSAFPVKGGDVGGSGIFSAGSFQIAYALPRRGYVFLYWIDNGVPISIEPFYGFTLDQNHDLTALFAKGRAKGRGRHR